MTIKEKSAVVKSVKRVKYSDGVAPHSSKLSGVKKIFVVDCMPNTPENYAVMQTILEKLGLGNLNFTFTCDIKMCLIILGNNHAQSQVLNLCIFDLSVSFFLQSMILIYEDNFPKMCMVARQADGGLHAQLFPVSWPRPLC